MIDNPKPGTQTTEFWGKVLLQIILMLNAFFGLGIDVSDSESVLIVGGLEALYQAVRGVLKFGHTAAAVPAEPAIQIVNTPNPPQAS